jgi:hypothetical protein
MYERHLDGMDSIEQEGTLTGEFLAHSVRDWCQSVVVKSNHDDAFESWLEHCVQAVHDPHNALLWHEANAEWHRRAKAGERSFLPIEWLLKRCGCPANVRFLKEDESFITCAAEDGGIENGLHGHRGANGMFGTPNGFSKMGRRINIGDKHSAGICDGVYVAGTSSLLDLKYNKGPSSWSQSHIVTYPHGARAIVTMWDGDYRGR